MARDAVPVTLPPIGYRNLTAGVAVFLAVSLAWMTDADADGDALQLRVVDRGCGFSYDPDRPAMAGHLTRSAGRLLDGSDLVRP